MRVWIGDAAIDALFVFVCWLSLAVLSGANAHCGRIAASAAGFVVTREVATRVWRRLSSKSKLGLIPGLVR